MRRAARASSSQPSLPGSACQSGPGTRGQPGRWSGARTLAEGGAELRSLHPQLVRSLTVKGISVYPPESACSVLVRIMLLQLYSSRCEQYECRGSKVLNKGLCSL